jgi:hypothetical protein
MWSACHNHGEAPNYHVYRGDRAISIVSLL